MSIQHISPTALQELRNQGNSIELIDVRTPIEFEEIHAENACNLPLDSLKPQVIMESRNGNADQPLYLICRSGSRAQQACELFQKAGYTEVVNVEGGTLAWEAAGLPVKRGKKMISLERQVRIVAGFLVLTGGILALTVHPYFAGFPAFIGAGLLFAGITDTCGMGMALAKMPWNQVKNSPTAGCGGGGCEAGGCPNSSIENQPPASVP